MIHASIFLFLLNVVVFIAIALIRQSNPLDLRTFFFLALVNLLAFFSAAVLTHDSPSSALNGLTANLLPWLLVLGAIATPLLVMALLSRGRSSSRRG
jgi:hypothetical protein